MVTTSTLPRLDHVFPLPDTAGYKLYRWHTSYQRGTVLQFWFPVDGTTRVYTQQD